MTFGEGMSWTGVVEGWSVENGDGSGQLGLVILLSQDGLLLTNESSLSLSLSYILLHTLTHMRTLHSGSSEGR